MLHIKFGFDWPSGLALIGQAVSEEMFEYIYTCILPWVGGICAHGVQFFSESLIFSPTVHFLQDFHFK